MTETDQLHLVIWFSFVGEPQVNKLVKMPAMNRSSWFEDIKFKSVNNCHNKPDLLFTFHSMISVISVSVRGHYDNCQGKQTVLTSVIKRPGPNDLKSWCCACLHSWNEATSYAKFSCLISWQSYSVFIHAKLWPLWFYSRIFRPKHRSTQKTQREPISVVIIHDLNKGELPGMLWNTDINSPDLRPSLAILLSTIDRFINMLYMPGNDMWF